MHRFCLDISFLQRILVWSVAILQTTDGGSITWYEPPPFETVTNDGVTFTSFQNLTEGSVNKELRFNFSLTANLTIVTVTITLDGDAVATYIPSVGTPSLELAFVGRFSTTWVPNKLTLIVLNVTPADKGRYRCEVLTSGGGVKRWKRIIEVDVFEPPKIIEVSRFTVHEGGNATLRCLAEGKPRPSITWTRLSDRSNITWARLPDGSVISRTLVNITRQNASVGYRCTATNGAGNPDIRDVFIDVQYKPDHVSLNVSTNKVCAGTKVLFTCSAGAANPAILNYSLHDKNSTGTVKTISNQGEVFALTVSMKGQHIYTCEAANSVGTTVSSSSTVEVQVPASVTLENDTIVVLEGENVTLRCIFSGFPSPNVSWINNSLSYIVDAERILELSNISRFSDAVYTCSASNTCGNESETVKIDVQYPVEAKGRGTEDTVGEGEKKIFSCPVDGNPKPNIKWYKGLNASGNPVSNETLLTVENIKESVCYTCFASNSRGTPVNISHCLIVNTTSALAITVTRPSDEPEGSTSPAWAIIGGATGGVALLAILVGVLTWWVHKQRKCRKDSKIHNSDLERHDGEGGHLQVQGVYAQSGPPAANGTDSAAEQQIEAEAAIPTYAAVDKSKKSRKQADERPPEYAVVDKSQKKKKQEEAAIPTYAAVDKSKKKKKSREEVPAVYAEVDKSKKKKKKKIDDKNLYDNLDEPKKEKKPGELLYADLGDFQNPSMPAVSISPQPLPAIKKADPYERTDYADITQFLKGNATLPPNDGNGDTEMKPKRPSKNKIQGNDKETPI